MPPLVAKRVLKLDQQLVRFEPPAIEPIAKVVVVDEKEIGDRLELYQMKKPYREAPKN